jgi:hypothetical protein
MLTTDMLLKVQSTFRPSGQNVVPNGTVAAAFELRMPISVPALGFATYFVQPSDAAPGSEQDLNWVKLAMFQGFLLFLFHEGSVSIKKMCEWSQNESQTAYFVWPEATLVVKRASYENVFN